MPKNSKSKVILSRCVPVITVNYGVTKIVARQLRLVFVGMILSHRTGEGVAKTPLGFSLSNASHLQEARSVGLIAGTAAVRDAVGDSLA